MENVTEARLSTLVGARVGVSGGLAVAGACSATERGFFFARLELVWRCGERTREG